MSGVDFFFYIRQRNYELFYRARYQPACAYVQGIKSKRLIYIYRYDTISLLLFVWFEEENGHGNGNRERESSDTRLKKTTTRLR